MLNYPGKHFWFLIFFLFWIADLHAQKESYNWYFGLGAGLNFATYPPTPLKYGKINTFEGCATISDKGGNLLFYTDGMTVYNRFHNLMPDGNGLIGHNSSSQSGVIVPSPENKSKYFVFSVDAIEGGRRGLYYSLVDMKLDSGRGDIIKGWKNKLLLKPTAEKVIAVRHKNCKDLWIVTHGSQNDLFHVFLLTDSGINLNYKTIKAGTISLEDRGYMKCSSDGSMIATTEGMNAAELFEFNNETGDISFLHRFDHDGVYGLEFSPNGRFLYSAHRYAGKIFQHDLTNFKTSLVTDVKHSMGALQAGPDGKIYIAQQSSKYLSVIHNPDKLMPACDFKLNDLYLEGPQSEQGFPNFVVDCYKPNFFGGGKNTCLGNSTKFHANSSHGPATFFWKFNDPYAVSDTSTLREPVHTYTKLGDYEVMLIASAAGSTYTIRFKIKITPPLKPLQQKKYYICPGDTTELDAGNPGAIHIWSGIFLSQKLKRFYPSKYDVVIIGDGCVIFDTAEVIMVDNPSVELGNDTSLCAGEKLMLDAGGNADFYLWSTGDTSQQIEVFKTARYWVIKSKMGCSVSDTISVQFKNSITLNLGNEKKVCPGETVTLDAGDKADSYLWSTGETTQKIFVNQARKYWVIKIKDGCTAADTVVISLKDTIKVNLGQNAKNCGGIEIVLDAGGNADSYLWSTKANTQKITVKDNGQYWVLKSKEDCTAIDTINISFFPAMNLPIIKKSLCEYEQEVFTIASPEGSNYLWSPNGETSRVISVSRVGLYSVTFNDINGCPQSQNFNIDNKCNYNLSIPNVFKPGSGFEKNHSFKAQGVNIETFKMQIYNRWGELIFSSDKIEEGWNGNYNGKECQEGVYLYVVQYTASTGKAIVNKYLSGTISLLR